METFSILLALCNPPITGGFPSQNASNMELCDVFFGSWTEQAVEKTVVGDFLSSDPHVTSL